MSSVAERTWRRLCHMFGVASISAPTIDTGAVQTAQVTFADGYGGSRDLVPVLQHFGFSSKLPIGTNVVVASFAGDRSSAVIIGSTGDAHRPTGSNDGETVVYDGFGNTIHLSSGQIVLTAGAGGTGNVICNAATLGCTGEVVAHMASGPIHLTTHEHPVSAAPGTTAAPNPGS
jgi:phage baseplate assembly protein V